MIELFTFFKEVIIISEIQTDTYQLSDTQGQTDDEYIALNQVGIRDLTLPMTLKDRESGEQQVTADLDVGVELRENQRGAHMSRFIELAEKYRQKTFTIDSISVFLEEICDRLEASNAFVNFQFDYFIEKESPLSGKRGIMDFRCGIGGRIRDGKTDNWILADVPVTTLCPCSKNNSHQGAHNQRALVETRVVIRDMVWLEEIIEMVEAEGSSQLYSILKREDEAFVTDEAYETPKFVEDVVRNLHRKMEMDERMGDFYVECLSYESIHNHNAYARSSTGSIWEQIELTQPGR